MPRPSSLLDSPTAGAAPDPTTRDAAGVPRSADVELALAKIWKEKGKFERALLGYQRVLQLSPAHLQATIEIPVLLLHLQRVPEALAAARQALKSFPNESQLHKSFVQALVAHTGSLAAAFEHYQLTRSDDKTVVVKNDHVLCCCAVRNELVRLPYFLSFYRQRGISTFLFVDNNSTDGTLSYLLQQPDVHVWRSSYSFNAANFGSAWFELLLRSYGVGHWCLIVDADELLYYPDCENQSLVTLCQELDAKNKHAFPALLLEMYSNKAIKDTHCASGEKIEDVCPYFDRQFFHTKSDDAGPYRNQTFYFGGVRQRVFGAAGDFLLSKVPLLKYDPAVVLAGGQHWTSLPKIEIAQESGCLLHFKFLAGFADYVAQEVSRKEHAVDAYQYKEYAKELARNEAVRLYDEQHSVRLRDSQQLVQLGIMQEDRPAGDHSIVAREIEFPIIRPRRPDEQRPLWSVMITAYNRVCYLEKALRSVLEQAPDSQAMGRQRLQLLQRSSARRGSPPVGVVAVGLAVQRLGHRGEVVGRDLHVALLQRVEVDVAGTEVLDLGLEALLLQERLVELGHDVGLGELLADDGHGVAAATAVLLEAVAAAGSHGEEERKGRQRDQKSAYVVHRGSHLLCPATEGRACPGAALHEPTGPDTLAAACGKRVECPLQERHQALERPARSGRR